MRTTPGTARSISTKIRIDSDSSLYGNNRKCVFQTSYDCMMLYIIFFAISLLFSGCGQKEASSAISPADIQVTSPTPPLPPTGVFATPGDSQATISWNPVSDANAYNIYWSTTTGVTKTTGTKVPGVSSPYTLTGLTNGSTYYFVVTAVDSLGESAESVQVSSSDISIANWLYGAEAAFSATFDDNNNDHITIVAPLFEKYNFRSTFGVIASYYDKVGYRTISDRGHEIANHSARHYNLTTLSSSDLDTEVNWPIPILTNDMGKRPVTFIHPYDRTTKEIDDFIFKTHLFTRLSSQYDTLNRTSLFLSPASTLDGMKLAVDNAITQKKWLILEGHGVDGAGYSPISSTLLDSFLSYLDLKRNVLWVDTLGHVGQYDYLRREVAIVAEKNGNDLVIKFTGYDQVKYQYMDTSPITVAIRNDNGYTIEPLDSSVIVAINGNIVFVTCDLKLNSQISLKITQ